MMKVLVLGPKHYLDELEENYRNKDFQLVYENSDTIFEHGLAKYLKQAEKKDEYDGYIGLIDDAAQVAAILSKMHGKPGPTLEGLLNCQNKFISRTIQSEAVPDMAVDFFASSSYDKKRAQFPLFVKPVRASMSTFAQIVEDDMQFQDVLSRYRQQPPKHLDNFIQVYALGLVEHEYLDTYKDLLCEAYIPHGTQITLDGFRQDGRVGWFGATRSVFLPNRISFKRFDFPFQLPDALHKKVLASMEKLIKASELDNTLFNIELKVDLETEDVRIIEINTRPSSQFMYPIQTVTGMHPLDVALRIATGASVGKTKATASNRACSVCILRTDKDARVVSVPQKSVITRLHHRYPGLRVNFFAWPGDKLSDFPQDSFTYRYAEIVIPHKVDQNINDMLFNIQSKLHFKLEEIAPETKPEV